MKTSLLTSSTEDWDLFREGDMDAFGRIYCRYYERLFNYGRRLLLENEATENQLHDLFLNLWQRRKRLPEVRTVEGYLLVIWRRQIFHDFKHARRFSVDYSDETAGGFSFSPEDFIIEQESQEEVQAELIAALKCLTERQREIIYLRYYQGLTLEQITDAISINYQSVSNHLQRAYKTLRRQNSLRSALEFS
ncbi:MAG: sigma-70 family RNA polymerase sigma factor [Catalinimonas sp.]